ncbi:MAG: FKBP-type peptidyl-prolyl cis-trans isomerase [Bdellovibrionaceae bacterium]|nr:FKBP-type peptidyl-prolyl cis-trans isomerase [Bdellovibrio sp.]
MNQTTTTNPKRVIAFNYILKNSTGEVLDKSDPNQPMPFLEGKQQILPALEAELTKMAEGDRKEIKLLAKESYGDFRADMIMEVPKEELAHLKLEMGAHLQLQMESQTRVVKVTKISETHVILDGNHPLAGVDLVFDVEIMLIREATADEIIHGHAHGLHGHAHHH